MYSDVVEPYNLGLLKFHIGLQFCTRYVFPHRWYGNCGPTSHIFQIFTNWKKANKTQSARQVRDHLLFWQDKRAYLIDFKYSDD